MCRFPAPDQTMINGVSSMYYLITCTGFYQSNRKLCIFYPIEIATVFDVESGSNSFEMAISICFSRLIRFFFCYSLVTFTFRHSIWLTRSAVCTIKVKSLVCSVNSTLIKSTSMLTPALVTISCSVFNTVQCIYLQRNDYIHFTCANANSNCMNGKNTFNS